jgi:hypothetical protein
MLEELKQLKNQIIELGLFGKTDIEFLAKINGLIDEEIKKVELKNK